MIFIQIISILFILNVCKGEFILSTCSAETPFSFNNFTCGSFEDICYKKDDNNCNILQKSCQQCPPTNYTAFMLNDILQITRNSINSSKRYIINETNIIIDSINSVRNMINETNMKNQLNNNETLIKLQKKIEEFSDSINSVKSYITKEINAIKNQQNNNNISKSPNRIEKLLDSINSVRNMINETNMKSQLNNNETLIKLQKKIEEFSDQLNNNYISKSPNKIEKLLDNLFICLLVIAIIIIIVLLAEVRFKIITKVIQRCIGTNRVNENCHDLSENSNNPLLDSRKSDSLKYELQNIKGEMNRIENVLLTTNTYALSELNIKIEKFYSDLDVQFQNFVKEANETISKIKHEFISQYESESTGNLK